MGNVPVGVLRNQFKVQFTAIFQRIPPRNVVFSQILPRLKWRFSEDRRAMDLARRRINSAVATFVIGSGGQYVKYPDIYQHQQFFCDDGVHLNELGNSIFLNTLQGAIESFMDSEKQEFPC